MILEILLFQTKCTKMKKEEETENRNQDDKLMQIINE